MEKKKVSQDFLYNFIKEHGMNVSALAEQMGMSDMMVNGCFRHNKDKNGNPRNFPLKTLPKLNAALEHIAEQLSQSRIAFGSHDTYTNNRGTQYDPVTVDGIKTLRKFFKLTPFLKATLGWSENKKSIVLHTPSSKGYACVSAQDVERINAAITEVSIVFSGIEVVADGDDAKTAERQEATREKGTRTRMEQTYEGKAYPWDNTDLGLQERSRLMHEQWPKGLLLFRVNGGYTAEGDDALYINIVDSSQVPFREPSSGMVTLYMDGETMERLLPRFVADGRRVAITNMYKD